MVGVKDWLGVEIEAALGDGRLDRPWSVSDVDGGAFSLPTPVFRVKSLENEVDVADELGVFEKRGLCFVEGVGVVRDSKDAAPGPLPTAGTEPTCLVVAAMEGPPPVDKAAASDDFDAVDEGKAGDGEGLSSDVTVASGSTDAAPGPLPTAATEPTCFEGSGARVEAAAAKLSLVEAGGCATGAGGMED